MAITQPRAGTFICWPTPMMIAELCICVSLSWLSFGRLAIWTLTVFPPHPAPNAALLTELDRSWRKNATAPPTQHRRLSVTTIETR